MADEALPDKHTLRALLAATDDFAAENVRAGNGGPFGASVHIYDIADKKLIPVGGLAANAVLKTGVASAHAEDQALQPAVVQALEAELLRLKGREVSVIFSSSAESCPACHAKEEIVCRRLEAEGLLKPGRFFVLYGATYRDSLEVAGFNDEPYHSDMQKRPGTGLIRQETQEAAALAPDIAKAFAESERPLALVVLKDGTKVWGRDARDTDAIATAEVSAIRQACRLQKQRGAEQPWDLGEARLYTATAEIGPLAYAEAQWANVTHWVSVTGLAPAQQAALATQESPGASNRDLFRAVAAKPYNQPGCTVQVLHVTPFDNKAQQAWREKLQREDAAKIVYNGIKVGKG